MFSKDASILSPGSSSQERMRSYGDMVEKLHIVVLNQKAKAAGECKNSSEGRREREIRIGRRLVLYPTNSYSKLSALFDAFTRGRAVLPGKEAPGKKHWLITAQDPFETGFVAWLLAARRGIALELQVHTDMESPFFKQESFTNAARAQIARFLIPRAQGVRAVSARIARALKEHANQPPDVLPVFVDAGFFRALPQKTDIRKKYPQFDFLVLMVSRLSREKDIQTALEAFRIVTAAHSRAGLIIVGDGPEREKLEQRTTEHQLRMNVVFAGWQEDLASYYRSADAYLLTSRYEGYGRTLMEAASLGCPVVSSDVGIVGEVFTHNENALVCPVGDAGCFAQALMRIRENEHLKRALSVRAEQTVNDHAVTKEEYLARSSALWRAHLRGEKPKVT